MHDLIPEFQFQSIMGYLAILIVLVFAAPLVLAFVQGYRSNSKQFMDFLNSERKKLLIFGMGVAISFIVNFLVNQLA